MEKGAVIGSKTHPTLGGGERVRAACCTAGQPSKAVQVGPKPSTYLIKTKKNTFVTTTKV
jgi:hypothetical protein